MTRPILAILFANSEGVFKWLFSNFLIEIFGSYLIRIHGESS
ncbi:hypothetical protein BY457_102251 [Marinilabilia salmonicolor]|jgi:hypothetical protein|nr:hypothetical protein BY457_102251 [Marinilabilia salmonicolor]